MANQEAAHPHMLIAGLRHHYIAPANRGPDVRHARLLIVNSGVFIISTVGAIVVIHTAGNPSATDDDLTYSLVAFLLFLLGIWLVLLALVADNFPRANRVDVAIARALHDYLLGGN